MITTKSYQGYYWTQKWQKIGQTSILRSFFARTAKKPLAEGRSHPQELKVGPSSVPYLLVLVKAFSDIYTKGSYKETRNLFDSSPKSSLQVIQVSQTWIEFTNLIYKAQKAVRILRCHSSCMWFLADPGKPGAALQTPLWLFHSLIDWLIL